MACGGAASVTNIAECQKRSLAAALELNRALEHGTDHAVDRSLLGAGATRRIDLIIGDLMKELAVVGHLFDIDIMQAGHIPSIAACMRSKAHSTGPDGLAGWASSR